MNSSQLRKYVRAVLTEADEGGKVIPMRRKEKVVPLPGLPSRQTHPLSNELMAKLRVVLASENAEETPPDQMVMLNGDELLQLLIGMDHGDQRALEAGRLYVKLLGYYDEMSDEEVMELLDSETDNDVGTVMKQLGTDFSGTPGGKDHHLTKIK